MFPSHDKALEAMLKPVSWTLYLQLKPTSSSHPSRQMHVKRHKVQRATCLRLQSVGLTTFEKRAMQAYNQAAKHQKSKAVDDISHSKLMSNTCEDQDANNLHMQANCICNKSKKRERN